MGTREPRGSKHPPSLLCTSLHRITHGMQSHKLFEPLLKHCLLKMFLMSRTKHTVCSQYSQASCWDSVVGQNPTLRIRCPSTHCTLLQIGAGNGHTKQKHGREPHQVIVTKDFPVAVDLVVLGLDMLHVGKADLSCLHGITALTQPLCQRRCPASTALSTKNLLFKNKNIE